MAIESIASPTSAILLSGGIDSTAIAFWKRPQVAITIDYGQASAEGEIRAASKIAHELAMDHNVVRANCRDLGAGDLAASASAKNSPSPEWWPFRNQLLVTLAAMRAYALGCTELIVGSLLSDSFHVDGSEEFYHRLNSVLVLQEGGLSVSTPAIHLTALELVQSSGVPLSILGWTHSCHKAAFACGQCRGCNKHIEIMRHLTDDT